MGARPEFSARASGIASSASAKARIAYCSRVEVCREETAIIAQQQKAFLCTKVSDQSSEPIFMLFQVEHDSISSPQVVSALHLRVRVCL